MISRTAKLALTLIGRAAAVAAFVRSRRVLSEKKPAYLVAEVEVTDQVAFQAYLKRAMETLKPYNVRVISNSKPDVKEGTPAQGHTSPGAHHNPGLQQFGGRAEMVRIVAVQGADP
jgi:hypothetical protein